MIDILELDAYLGKNIQDICPRGYVADNLNHCAHFVSHVLGLNFGMTCGNMVHGKGEAATIRVNEIFERCPQVGRWEDQDRTCFYMGLVFITNPKMVNIQNRTMGNQPRKHVGIFIGSKIWHYSNTKDCVVWQTPEQFGHHYRAPHNAMFWGQLPFEGQT
jgi:hypothetical protein